MPPPPYMAPLGPPAWKETGLCGVGKRWRDRRVVLPLPVLNAVPCKLASGLGQALGTLYLVRLATGQRPLGALRPQGANPNPHWLNPTSPHANTRSPGQPNRPSGAWRAHHPPNRASTPPLRSKSPLATTAPVFGPKAVVAKPRLTST